MTQFKVTANTSVRNLASAVFAELMNTGSVAVLSAAGAEGVSTMTKAVAAVHEIFEKAGNEVSSRPRFNRISNKFLIMEFEVWKKQ